MPTAIKIWEIAGPQLTPADESNMAAAHVESELETWICHNPELLGDRLLIIDRQRDIPGVGVLDLLAMDEAGNLVIIELKRDRAPREAVAQALDYASWLNSANEEQIETRAEQYLQKPLRDAFADTFGTELPEYTCQNHRIVLAAPRLDESAERIVNYLAERHGVEINAVFFRYCKLSDGKEILARAFLMDTIAGPVGKPKHPTLGQLLAVATEKQTTGIIDVCRQMRQTWRETSRSYYRGSLQYWAAPTPGAQERMVFGVNIAGYKNPLVAQLDVWIPTKSLAEVTGVSETEVRQKLRDTALILDLGNVDCWVRLKKPEDAQLLVAQLQAWARNQAGAASA